MQRTCQLLNALLLSSVVCLVLAGGPSNAFAQISSAALNDALYLDSGLSQPAPFATHVAVPRKTQHVNADGMSSRLAEPSLQPVYYFYEPLPMESGASFFQVGASVSLLPYPDSEQEVPIPGLDVQYKRGLTESLSLAGSFSTSIFSYLVHGGLQWNTRLDRFSLGLAGHAGFAYGFITRANLFDDVQAFGLFVMPILRCGYRFDAFVVSCSFVLSYVFRSASYVNGLEASVGPQYSINDYYCTLVVEQPFMRDQHISIGLSLGYARTPYQSWMLYNTVEEWLFVPEFFFAIQL